MVKAIIGFYELGVSKLLNHCGAIDFFYILCHIINNV